MPFTVITLKNVPNSLRGDLTKWMQEIATGVYVGNFNSRVRDNLWARVCEAVGAGEATMSFACRNETGYAFETLNAERRVVDFDGIPLVLLPAKAAERKPLEKEHGFSQAYKMHQARKFSGTVKRTATGRNINPYVVIDIETTGLDEDKDQIMEIGAVKCSGQKTQYFQQLIRINACVPLNITKLTGISSEMLKEGVELKDALLNFVDFIQDCPLTGYNINFDLKFLNTGLETSSMQAIRNRTFDLMKAVKQEKIFQKDYKLQTTLESYGIRKEIPHRALEDAKLVYELSKKVNKFCTWISKQ